jgi:Mg-chelatase subunit ChlD
MRTLLVALIAALAAARDSYPQAATTDAGVQRTSLLLRSGRLPSPDEVRVYDFVNYHRHAELPEPKDGARVALDARLLMPALPKGRATASLQVGICTSRPKRDRDAKPVNLCLVIDQSGSMGDAKKMEFVKKGLELFVDALTESDLLSIVVFHDDAHVLRPASAVGDPRVVIDLIRTLQPQGSTNLHAGLMLGYAEVRKNIGTRRSHKVILLSDGQANRGVVDPERIAADSREFNEAGIDLATVGIGLAYNDALMSRLAAAGRGTYHFLDSAEGIERTFLTELNSLLEKVGRQASVRVQLAEGVTLRRVYGYDPSSPSPGVLEFKLLDLPLGLTQIIPMEIDVAEGVRRVTEARLTYVDAARDSEVSMGTVVEVERTDSEPLPCPDVLKNFTITRLAQAFKDACVHSAAGRAGDAREALLGALRTVEATHGPRDKVADKDLRRVLTLVAESLDLLQGAGDR